LISFFIVIVDVESVEIAKDDGVARGIEFGVDKISDIFIIGVVKPLHKVAIRIIKRNFGIISGCHHVLAPT